MRSKGTAAELEARRRLAVQRVGEGWAPNDVAAFLGVHPVTVKKWLARHRAGGGDGLAAKPTPGRPRFLTAEQEKRVLVWLAELPTAHGFDTDLWTARRVAELIYKTFGVRFHPSYLREWLTERGLTPQQPARRARQRNPGAIARWVAEDWPRIQERRPTSTPTSSRSAHRVVPEPAGAPQLGAARAHPGGRRGRRAPQEGVGHRGGHGVAPYPRVGAPLEHPRGRVFRRGRSGRVPAVRARVASGQGGRGVGWRDQPQGR